MSKRGQVPIVAHAAAVYPIRRHEDGWRVLLLARTDAKLRGAWCNVAGGIEPGETAWQAALRELREETGLEPERLYSADTCEQYYDARRECIVITPVFVAFIGPDARVVLDHEHSDHRWASFEQARELVRFSGQRSMLRHVREEFTEREPNDFLLVWERGE